MGHLFQWLSPVIRDIHPCSRTFSGGATCFNDRSLSRLGFEHPIFRMRSTCSNRIHHCRDETLVKKNVC